MTEHESWTAPGLPSIRTQHQYDYGEGVVQTITVEVVACSETAAIMLYDYAMEQLRSQSFHRAKEHSSSTEYVG